MKRVLIKPNLHRPMGRLKGFESDAMRTAAHPIPHMLRHIAPIKVTRQIASRPLCIPMGYHDKHTENVSASQDLKVQKSDSDEHHP